MIHVPSDHVIPLDPAWSWKPIPAETATRTGQWVRVVKPTPGPSAWVRPPVGSTAAGDRIRDAGGRAWDVQTCLGRARREIADWSLAAVAQPRQTSHEAPGALDSPGAVPTPPDPAPALPWSPGWIIGRTADGRPIRNAAAPGWIRADGDKGYRALDSLANLRGASETDQVDQLAPDRKTRKGADECRPRNATPETRQLTFLQGTAPCDHSGIRDGV